MPEYELWAEKLCLIYMAAPVIRYGDPLEPGHTALCMDVDEALNTLANSGDRDFVARFESHLPIFQKRSRNIVVKLGTITQFFLKRLVERIKKFGPTMFLGN